MNKYQINQVVTVRISDNELIRHCTIASIKIEPHNVKYDVVKGTFRFYDVNESSINPIENQAYKSILGEH
jgi:hypothetical protein